MLYYTISGGAIMWKTAIGNLPAAVMLVTQLFWSWHMQAHAMTIPHQTLRNNRSLCLVCPAQQHSARVSPVGLNVMLCAGLSRTGMTDHHACTDSVALRPGFELPFQA